MEITVKKLSDLKKAELNIRRHGTKQIEEYIRSIKMFGQIKPIVVDEHGEIIAGNGLYEAMSQMGLETCDCYVISGLTANQKKKLMLADNKVYELGITDMDAFDKIVADLKNDVDIPGYDAELLKMLTSTAQEAVEEITNYGNYSNEEIQAVANRSNPIEKTVPVSTATVQTVTNEDDDETEEYEEDETPTQTHKYVICPHCNEKIWL